MRRIQRLSEEMELKSGSMGGCRFGEEVDAGTVVAGAVGLEIGGLAAGAVALFVGMEVGREGGEEFGKALVGESGFPEGEAAGVIALDAEALGRIEFVEGEGMKGVAGPGA